MQVIRTFLEKLFAASRTEEGQTVIEYILVIVLIALVLVVAFNKGGVVSGVQQASQYIGQQLTNSIP